jgi:large subunit ribosomal protein L25
MATTTSRPRLAATDRTVTGKHVARLRRAGQLPGVVYGHGVESRNVSLDAHEFDLFRRHSGPNTLFDLAIDGARAATPALVHGIQVHPLTRRPVHVDLLAVRMTEELVVEVPVVLVGLAPAVERDGGTLSHLNSIRVRALPDHLPQSFEASVESLDSFDAALHVRDLAVPSDVTILNDPDEVVARVLPPRVVEAEVPTAADVAAGAPAGEAEGATASEAGSGSEGSSES